MIKTRLFTLLVLMLLINELSAQVSPKRGLAYGYHSTQDLDAIKPGVSWWYNWASVPDNAIKDYYSSQGVEFVPMVWNNAYTVADVIANIPDDAKYILAFNEPNFTVESNMTPAQAVAAWPKIEQVAAAKNLEIVSAVPAYCGGGVCIPGYTDPTTWHNEFFALCPTCKVDYIAFHNYEPTVGGLVALTNNLKIYGRPIWVTEFAYWDAATEANKINYLQTAVSAFENDPDIYRYSWFTGRSTPNPSIDILGANGVLTNLGSAYINAAYGPKVNIPGTIQAEDVYRRRGTDLQACTDAGGGENVGWTDPGTWNEFIVNVNATGSYTFNFRVASNVNTGAFNITLDGQTVKSTITVASTGGWQTWTDLIVTGVVLPAGEHLLRLNFTGTGTNINYFTTTFESSVPAIANFSATPLSVCAGNTVVFTDLTTTKSGSETYAWNFGVDATPATAIGIGPHSVTYSSGGQKTVSLNVTNANGSNVNTKNNYINVSAIPTTCLFSDDYNNGTINWINPTNGAFTHNEAGSDWVITNGGYDQWEYFNYTLNNGAAASYINFECAANKPIVKIRARATANCALNVSMLDANGRSVDNYANTVLELTPTYQTFTIDFAERFRNYYSGNPGIVDSANIDRLQFFINPGYVSYPIVGANATYNSAFAGTVYIDWIGIGDNACSTPLPISLLSFNVTKSGTTSSSINWTTSSILPSNTNFEIVRSTGGGEYITVGTLNATETNGIANSYSFIDAGLSSTTYYYMIKQIDNDGTVSYSPVESIDMSDNDIDVVPTSVVKGELIYINSNNASEIRVDVIDVSGKLYKSKIVASNTESYIDTQGLDYGLYLVKIIANNNVLTKKIIIH